MHYIMLKKVSQLPCAIVIIMLVYESSWNHNWDTDTKAKKKWTLSFPRKQYFVIQDTIIALAWFQNFFVDMQCYLQVALFLNKDAYFWGIRNKAKALV